MPYGAVVARDLRKLAGMQTYVILSQFDDGVAADPKSLRQAADEVSRRIKDECPEIEWRESYVLMGAYDVVDIVDAANPEAVTKAAMIIRAHGKAQTETMLATPWKTFIERL